MFKFYLRASLLLTALALLALLTAMREGHSSSGFDLLICAGAFILAFIHSGIVSLIYLVSRKDQDGSWAMLAHAAFVVMPFALLAINAGREHYEEMQLQASPGYKMDTAIASGTVEEFDREWARAHADGATPRLDDVPSYEDWALQAATHGRLDILQSLAAHGALGLDAQASERYGNLVHAAAVCSDERCATQRLPTVQWLVEQGKAHGLTLKSASGQLFGDDAFVYSYDLANADTVKMIELMIAEGADINAGDADDLLRAVVSANKPEHLKFLLAHGYPRSKLSRVREDGRSLLRPAISDHAPEMVEALLAAGVVAQHSRDDDDVMLACRDPYEGDADRAQAVIAVLKRHGVRLTKAQFEVVTKDREPSETELQCLRGFEH